MKFVDVFANVFLFTVVVFAFALVVLVLLVLVFFVEFVFALVAVFNVAVLLLEELDLRIFLSKSSELFTL